MENSVSLLLCQGIGSLAGMIGSWAISCQPRRYILWGFICFAISNVFIIIYFIAAHAWPLLAMQVFFLATSIRGIKNNWSAWERSKSANGLL